MWMTTVRQPTKRRCPSVLTLKYTFICVYWWTRQRIHNTLIAVDRYLRLMGNKTIPDSAEPRLESSYPPFVAGIDLPHQGVVDSYSQPHDCWYPCFWPRTSTAMGLNRKDITGYWLLREKGYQPLYAISKWGNHFQCRYIFWLSYSKRRTTDNWLAYGFNNSSDLIRFYLMLRSKFTPLPTRMISRVAHFH